MQAAVLVAPRHLEIREVPRPTPAAGQVRVRLEGCGVCASNLAMWEGMPWSRYPTAPGDMGHESWGTIDAVARGVTNVKEGDRVAMLSYKAYAHCDVAPATAVVALPKSLDGAPFPGEAFGCAMNIFARSDIQRGHTVAIVGIGFLGAILTRLAAQAGARVIAISRRPYSLAVASQMGAHETIPMEDHHRIIARVAGLTNGAMCERVIEAVGKQWPLDLAAELTATRARLIVAGYHQDGPRQVNMQLWNWRGLDVINAHEREPERYIAGMRAAVAATEAGVFDPRALCTHSFPLQQLGDALDAALERPEGFLKAVVRCE
ncbi:MAG: zinc-binding dehydrogenase [Candidatus Koribacter versatilis]|uniref:Zinc-binding dehydrogenase n=1 Tax=Candidatus Korobacter versatilis TaxID=658062 RepID=A0A932A847_9BACT|nr:zinc-binding dehydrogenase [Candidatus Koribacter versatilis]